MANIRAPARVNHWRDFQGCRSFDKVNKIFQEKFNDPHILNLSSGFTSYKKLTFVTRFMFKQIEHKKMDQKDSMTWTDVGLEQN